jgi:hypothetical protein
MAETAAILSPTKRVLLPDLRAGCSLAATVTADDVRRWKAEFPGYISVGYVNTTAEVKAELDYCCTSGNVLDVIDAIPEDRGILFLPDFFLGAHVRRMRPHRRVEVWMGECHVHKGIRAETLNAARERYPDAEVLVHPECGCAGQLIYEMGRGDIRPEGLHIASTEGMIRAATERPVKRFIVATETSCTDAQRRPPNSSSHRPQAVLPTWIHQIRDSRAGPVSQSATEIARRAAPHHRMVALVEPAPRLSPRSPRETARPTHHRRHRPPASPPKGGSSSAAAACWQGAPTPTRWRPPATAASSGGRPTGGRSRPAPSSGWSTVTSPGSCAPSGLCSTCCSARAGSPPRPGHTSARSQALPAASSTPARPLPGSGRSTSPRSWPAAERATAPT